MPWRGWISPIGSVILAVGKPSSRPRFSPCSTMPSTVHACPSSAWTFSGSPARKACRIAVDEALSSKASTFSTIVTPKPNARPREESLAASPIRPRPKRKSNPTATCAAPSPSAITSRANASSVIPAMSALNGNSNTACAPIFKRAALRRSGVKIRKGGSSGLNSARGGGSNVAIPKLLPDARAASITALCPAWIPSKLPSAMARPRAASGIFR